MKTTTNNKKKLLKGIKAKASEITKRAKAAKEHLLNGNFKSKTLVVAPRNITSEEALEILKHRNFLYKNEQQVSTNRDLVARTVARIRMDIQEGEWRTAASRIMFDTSGQLIDGQHTLAAIAESGRNVDAMFFLGVPKDTIQKIDVSRPRTVAQRLKFSGALPLESNVDSKFRVDIANLILRTKFTPLGKPIPEGRKLAERAWYNDKKIIDTCNKYKDHIEYFMNNKSKKAEFKKVSLIAPMVLARSKNQKKAEEFYMKFLNPDLRTSSKNKAPAKLNWLVSQIAKCKKEGVAPVKELLRQNVERGKSWKPDEASFWFWQSTKAINAYINSKSYPSMKINGKTYPNA